jgi:hypothetical protein
VLCAITGEARAKSDNAAKAANDLEKTFWRIYCTPAQTVRAELSIVDETIVTLQ